MADLRRAARRRCSGSSPATCLALTPWSRCRLFRWAVERLRLCAGSGTWRCTARLHRDLAAVRVRVVDREPDRVSHAPGRGRRAVGAAHAGAHRPARRAEAHGPCRQHHLGAGAGGAGAGSGAGRALDSAALVALAVPVQLPARRRRRVAGAAPAPAGSDEPGVAHARSMSSGSRWKPLSPGFALFTYGVSALGRSARSACDAAGGAAARGRDRRAHRRFRARRAPQADDGAARSGASSSNRAVERRAHSPILVTSVRRVRCRSSILPLYYQQVRGEVAAGRPGLLHRAAGPRHAADAAAGRQARRPHRTAASS